jgi:hypothetical protein
MGKNQETASMYTSSAEFVEEKFLLPDKLFSMQKI